MWVEFNCKFIFTQFKDPVQSSRGRNVRKQNGLVIIVLVPRLRRRVKSIPMAVVTV